jgi:hypothetical protein
MMFLIMAGPWISALVSPFEVNETQKAKPNVLNTGARKCPALLEVQIAREGFTSQVPAWRSENYRCFKKSFTTLKT